MDTYKVAISDMALSGKLAEGDSRWLALNDSFRNVEATDVDLLDAIYCGRPYTAWHNGRRKHENFVAAQAVCVDLDTEDERSTFDAVQRNHFFRLHGSMMHTTPSHTPQAPRARAIFLLDQPILTAAGYRLAIETVYTFFDGADPACIDPSRFFYGNLALQADPDGIWYSDRILPLAELRCIAKQQALIRKRELAQQDKAHKAQHAASYENATAYARKAFEAEVAQVARTREGGRNKQLVTSAFNLGTLVAAGALDEALVVDNLKTAALQIGLPEKEVIRTLNNGLNAGKQNPRVVH